MKPADLLPWKIAEARRAARTPAATPAATPPSPGVLPNRSGFVQGVPQSGFGENEASSATGTAVNTDRATFLQELWEEYLKCPWAFASVNAIARTVTVGGLVMKWDGDTGEGDQKQPDKPPAVLAFERLIAFCNPTQDIRQLMRNTVADLQVFGGAMIEVVWFAGLPVALYNQDFPTTFPETDEHGNVERYKQVTETGQTATFRPEQIIHITLDSARPSIFGISPTHAAEESIVAWMYLHACEKEMARRGLPPTIHADHPAGMADKDVEIWQDKYATRNIGPSNIGTPITTKGGGKVAELQQARLTEILSAKKDARDEVICTYGVPPAKLGIIESGNLGGGTGSDQNKALDLMTMIPTPAGWTTMGELKPGDEVLDETGRPCKVVSTHEVPDASSWRLKFSDGTHIDACLDHLWVTWTAADRKAYGRGAGTAAGPAVPENWPQWKSGRGLGPAIRRTEEILDTLHAGNGRLNHSIPVTGALELPEADLPLDPYVLGAWLGDGTADCAAITCGEGDEQILDEIRAAGYKVTGRRPAPGSGRCPYYDINGGFLDKLRDMDLLGNKHVPGIYLRASKAQRIALLRGLMDTDGGWAARPQCVFTSSLEHLADAVMELTRSLGQKPVKAKRRVVPGDIEYSPQFRVTWTPTIQPFRLRRKAERFRRDNARRMRVHHRTIVGAEKIADRPMRCIKVDSPNAMYLAGEAMIPTHNTFMLDVVNPVAQLIAEKMQFALAVRAFGVAGWHAEFPTTDYRDDKVIEDIRDQRLRNGSWTLNRYRSDIREPGVDGGDDAVLVARQDIVLWSDMADRSAAAVAALGAGAGRGLPGPPPATGTQPSKGPGGAPSETAAIAEAVIWRLAEAGVLEHTAKLTIRQRVWNQLSRNFPASSLRWVQDPGESQWQGPEEVHPDQVDTADMDEWAADHQPEVIARLRRRLRRGRTVKPVVMVRPPGAEKDIIVDGHHRALAAIREGRMVRAWIGHVNSQTGAWQTLATRQHRASPGTRKRKASESLGGGGGPDCGPCSRGACRQCEETGRMPA